MNSSIFLDNFSLSPSKFYELLSLLSSFFFSKESIYSLLALAFEGSLSSLFLLDVLSEEASWKDFV